MRADLPPRRASRRRLATRSRRYGEGAGQPAGYVHYTKGGLPGYFPDIAGRIGPFPIGNVNLYKPFDIFPEQSEEEKTRGRQVEINNGARPRGISDFPRRASRMHY